MTIVVWEPNYLQCSFAAARRVRRGLGRDAAAAQDGVDRSIVMYLDSSIGVAGSDRIVLVSGNKDRGLRIYSKDATVMNERVWKPFVVKHAKKGELELNKQLLGAFVFTGADDTSRAGRASGRMRPSGRAGCRAPWA